MKICLLLLTTLLVGATARADDAEPYQAQFQPIAATTKVPKSIARATKTTGPTRFFATFTMGASQFAVRLSDSGKARTVGPSSLGNTMEKQSRVDVYRATPDQSWRLIQTFAFQRRFETKRDKPQIEARALWLDPARRTVPMLYLKIAEEKFGNTTDVYGVLQASAVTSFIAFQGFVPQSMSTVTLSQISFPDAAGRVTLLEIVSDPGSQSDVAYAWKAGWQRLDEANWENGYETALRWNGTKFVPFAQK